MPTTELSYTTKDWNEAALLLLHDAKLVRTWAEGSVTYFEFRRTPASAKVVNDFYNGTLKVSAREFVDYQRRVKDLIHHSRVSV